MPASVEDYVFAYFSERSSDFPAEREERLVCAYLDTGLLDSFGIVEMIADLEEEFSISFTPDDMQSDDFRTVGGLVTIVERETGATSGEGE